MNRSAPRRRQIWKQAPRASTTVRGSGTQRPSRRTARGIPCTACGQQSRPRHHCRHASMACENLKANPRGPLCPARLAREPGRAPGVGAGVRPDTGCRSRGTGAGSRERGPPPPTCSDAGKERRPKTAPPAPTPPSPGPQPPTPTPGSGRQDPKELLTTPPASCPEDRAARRDPGRRSDRGPWFVSRFVRHARTRPGQEGGRRARRRRSPPSPRAVRRQSCAVGTPSAEATEDPTPLTPTIPPRRRTAASEGTTTARPPDPKVRTPAGRPWPKGSRHPG